MTCYVALFLTVDRINPSAKAVFCVRQVYLFQCVCWCLDRGPRHRIGERVAGLLFRFR